MTPEHLIVVLVWIAGVAQTAFVCLWVSLPWWRSVIGRALMVKSCALAIYLDVALVNYYLPPYAGEVWVMVGLFGAVAVGILTQLYALIREVVIARRDRRYIPGTAPHTRRG